MDGGKLTHEYRKRNSGPPSSFRPSSCYRDGPGTQSCAVPGIPINAAAAAAGIARTKTPAAADPPGEEQTSPAAVNVNCFFCGYNRHLRNKWPAKGAIVRKATPVKYAGHLPLH